MRVCGVYFVFVILLSACTNGVSHLDIALQQAKHKDVYKRQLINSSSRLKSAGAMWQSRSPIYSFLLSNFKVIFPNCMSVSYTHLWPAEPWS